MYICHPAYFDSNSFQMYINCILFFTYCAAYIFHGIFKKYILWKREQRKESKFLDHLSTKRNEEARKKEALDDNLTEQEKEEREGARSRAEVAMKHRKSMDMEALEILSFSKNQTTHWSRKALNDMTERDWRIFREDFDIRIQGGRAIRPLRYWEEANFPEQIGIAINDLGYKEIINLASKEYFSALQSKNLKPTQRVGGFTAYSGTVPATPTHQCLRWL